MKKSKSLTKKVINPLAILDTQKIDQFKALVKQTMPEFVAEVETKEDMGNAMYASSQEMWIAIMDTLVRYHGWKESEIQSFTNEMKDILTGAKEFEDSGLSMLSPHSMGIVGDKIQEVGIGGLLAEIAETRFKKERINRLNMATPVLQSAAPFIKELKKRNNGK